MKNAAAMFVVIEAGDSQAAEQLVVTVSDELMRLAASRLAQDAPGQTLHPTALVHEAWLGLVGGQNPSFKHRTHFFRASAEAMLHHRGGYRREHFEDFNRASPSADDQVLPMNDELAKLALEHSVRAEVVKLGYFARLTNQEVSEVRGISVSTVKDYWAGVLPCLPVQRS
jgi:RNA polymerase sigma factor (TIGR02999 family)